MNLGEIIDAVIEPFNPRWARERLAERERLAAFRQYDAAGFGRRTQGWSRPGTSANAETRRGIVGLRNASHDLVRNNKFANNIVQQVAAHIWGDGISLRLTHPNKQVAAKAQAAWDGFCESLVDGRNDFYALGFNAVRGMVEGGETLLSWGPDDDGPDGRVRLLEGDWLDHWKQAVVPAGKDGAIIQGVQFKGNGDRAGYWLFDQHPGDIGGWGMGGGYGFGGHSTLYDAANIDHLFREDRPGQVRGVPWLAPVMMTLRELADLEDATLMKKKVEACLALILTPPDGGGPPNPFDPNGAVTPNGAGGAAGQATTGASDTIRPGMVFRARPGETAQTLVPTSSGDSVDFARNQMMGVAAGFAPYHFVTGDPSQANYSSARALTLPFHANLDVWQHLLVIPQLVMPAFRRRMRRLYLETGDKRVLQVKAVAAPPVRRQNDPIKDGMGEQIAIRGGVKSMPHALTERGLNPEKHLQEIADFNKQADALGLAFDTDPRRITDAGQLQATAPYLFGTGGAPAQGD